MNNFRNSYTSVPNQPDRYDSGTRPTGWRVPATSSPNSWSRSDSVQPSHTLHQIPIPNNNNLRGQHNSRSVSQAREEDEVLKHLTKTTYEPVPKSLLLRNLSLYYRNKNSRNARDLSYEEDEKRCVICLEYFEPKETVMLTPCKHMFHEECIVPWLNSKGQCPLCRFVIMKPEKRQDSSPGNGSNLVGDMTVNDLFALELISVVRAMEETFLFGFPRRL